MSAVRVITFLLFASLFVGCSIVKTPVPFGLKPVEIEPGHFSGRWEMDDEDDDTLEIKILDEANAVLELSYRDGDGMRKIKAHLLVGKKWQYVSLPAADDGSDSEGYLFGLIKSTPNRIIVWVPKVEKFKQLIEAGKISGKVGKDEVTLDKVTPEVIDIIESEENGFVFEWLEPLILTKLKSPVAESKKAK